MTSCDTLSPRKFTKHILYQLCLGFASAIRGFIFSWNNTCMYHQSSIQLKNKKHSISDVWKTQQRSLLSLLICTLIIYVTLVIIFLPFRFIVWLVSFAYAFAPSFTEWFEHVSSARTLLLKLLTFIPLLAVFIMNNLLGILNYSIIFLLSF